MLAKDRGFRADHRNATDTLKKRVGEHLRSSSTAKGEDSTPKKGSLLLAKVSFSENVCNLDPKSSKKDHHGPAEGLAEPTEPDL